MAAVTRAPRPVVRAARPGEGAAVAALWRELWDAHERWGGYAGSRDPRVYAQVASRLDEDARVRSGRVVLGRHAHLLAEIDGVPCGQVEGWLDHLGAAPDTPLTCEVRSLIVAPGARRSGAGRALLAGLAETALARAGGAACVLAAEVLEPNPAHAFYARVGYAPVAWSARVDSLSGMRPLPVAFGARLAVPHDALAIARLEASLAQRRRDAGDARFDRPHAIDAAFVEAIAAHLHESGESGSGAGDAATLVAVDGAGGVRAAASFTVQILEPPFLPVRRALLGRFALDPAHPAPPLLAALVSFGCRLALSRGAQFIELTDLTAPGTELHGAAIATGARPWSRVVIRALRDKDEAG
jgi:GNAT superfamily N-acetyltransferase